MFINLFLLLTSHYPFLFASFVLSMLSKRAFQCVIVILLNIFCNSIVQHVPCIPVNCLVQTHRSILLGLSLLFGIYIPDGECVGTYVQGRLLFRLLLFRDLCEF